MNDNQPEGTLTVWETVFIVLAMCISFGPIAVYVVAAVVSDCLD